MNAVLIVGAGMLQVPLIHEAKHLGLAVIATDANPQAPGAALADAFYPVDTYDLPGHQRLGQELLCQSRWQMRGVVTCGSDTAPSVAVAAQALGCRGIPVEVAELTHNKAQVRQVLKNAGLDCYQPQWIYIEEAGEKK